MRSKYPLQELWYNQEMLKIESNYFDLRFEFGLLLNEIILANKR